MRIRARRIRAVSGIAVAAAVALLAGLASTAALASGGTTAQASVPGTITTIAGGLGGPGPALTVGTSPCAVTYAGQALYVGDTGIGTEFDGGPAVVRKIVTSSGALTTVAGNGVFANNDDFDPPGPPDGSSARSTPIEDACGIAIDHAGNILVSDSARYEADEEVAEPYGIRVVAEATGKFYGRQMVKGREYTLVRSASPALAGDAPGAIAVDSAGNVLFTGDDDRILARAVRTGTFYGIKMQAGGTYPVAGGGESSEDGIPAVQAGLALIDPDHFQGIADAGLRIDHHGNLIVADQFHGLVRAVAASNGTFYGQSMRTGHIYTIAGDSAVDPGVSPDGGLATKTGLFDPGHLAIDHHGNVIMDNGGWILALAESTGKFYGRSMVRGHLYRIAGSAVGIFRNGIPARQTGPIEASALSADGSGNVVIAQDRGLLVVPPQAGTFYGQRMRALHIYSITLIKPNERAALDSGDDGLATRAELHVGQQDDVTQSLDLLATDAQADVFVASHREVRIIGGASGTRFGQQVQAGHIYRIAGDGQSGPISKGAQATKTAIDVPDGIGTDAAGNLLIAAAVAGRVLVVAARTGTFYGQAMTAGHLYFVAGNGGSSLSGDGGPALSASIGPVLGVSADAAGNLLIATSCELRVVAEVTGTSYGQAMTAGDIYPIAGTAACSDSADGTVATSANLSQVGMTAVDSSGNVLFTDHAGIRVVAETTGTFYGQSMTAGDLYTIQARTAYGGFTIDGAGNVVVADDLGNSISVLAATTGTFYGVPMTAGQTFQIAGNGVLGHSGDGGPATAAALAEPTSVLAMADGSLVDAEFRWIRKITGQ